MYNFGSTSTKWIMIRLKATDFKRFSKYFHNYFLLLYLYFTSTLFLPYLYIIPTNHLPYLLTLHLHAESLRLIVCSQHGNVMFPAWEHHIPTVGTILPPNGNLGYCIIKNNATTSHLLPFYRQLVEDK